MTDGSLTLNDPATVTPTGSPSPLESAAVDFVVLGEDRVLTASRSVDVVGGTGEDAGEDHSVSRP